MSAVEKSEKRNGVRHPHQQAQQPAADRFLSDRLRDAAPGVRLRSRPRVLQMRPAARWAATILYIMCSNPIIIIIKIINFFFFYTRLFYFNHCQSVDASV